MFKHNFEKTMEEELKRLFREGYYLELWTHGFCDDRYTSYDSFIRDFPDVESASICDNCVYAKMYGEEQELIIQSNFVYVVTANINGKLCVELFSTIEKVKEFLKDKHNLDYNKAEYNEYLEETYCGSFTIVKRVINELYD